MHCKDKIPDGTKLWFVRWETKSIVSCSVLFSLQNYESPYFYFVEAWDDTRFQRYKDFIYSVIFLSYPAPDRKIRGLHTIGKFLFKTKEEAEKELEFLILTEIMDEL